MLVFCFIHYAQAQNAKIDSLKHVLLIEQPDTARCMTLISLAYEYTYLKPDTALFLAQEGLSLAKKISFTAGEANGMSTLGQIFMFTGNYPKALELFFEVLKIAEKLNKKRAIAYSMNDIGSLYTLQGDYQKSLYYRYQALEIAEELQLKPFLEIFLLNLGDTYEKLNQLDSARLFTQRAYDLSISTGNIDNASTALGNMGNIYSKMGQPVIAMEFYRDALSHFEKQSYADATAEFLFGIAKLFQFSNSDSTLHYANRAFTIAKNGGVMNQTLPISTFLADFHKNQHNYDSAFAYLQETMAAKDSLFNQERNIQLQNLSFAEMLRQQEISEKLASESIERQNNLQYIIIMIGIICFAVLFILLSRSININEKWVEFLGVLGLLIVFEYINLLIHPYLNNATEHSPGWMLLVMVGIAALLVPLHHRIERWISKKLIIKNRARRLAVARKVVKNLEGKTE